MIELYKAYIGDLGNIGGRYATANGFYLSVVTALIAVLALGETDKPLAGLGVGFVPVLCLFAIVICAIWFLTIRYYGKLFGAKFATLKKMEEKLDFAPYEFEYKLLTDEYQAGKLTDHERWVPVALGLLFLLIGVAAVMPG
jgi:hypothetical protein